MTGRTRALRLSYGALALADTALAGLPGRRAQLARRLTKPLLMPVLAAGFAADPRARHTLRNSTAAGLGFGWLGDLALLGTGTPAFAAGMGAFGAGQVAYLTGLRRVSAPKPLHRSGIALVAAALTAGIGPVMARGAARESPLLGPGVLAYAGLLATMAAQAAHLDPALPRGARVATAAGGLLFLTSDTLLGLGQFVLADPPGPFGAAVMATYAAGQYLLADGALRAAG